MAPSVGHGVTDERQEVLAGDGEITSTRFPATQSRLHNFSFPTINWNGQRALCCVKPISGGVGLVDRSTDPDTQIQPRGETNVSYSHVSALPMSSRTGGDKEKTSSAAAEVAAAPMALLWNLRKRRDVCQAPLENGRNKCHCPSPSNMSFGKSVMRRSAVVGQNTPRKKFSVSLSRVEIEEDYLMFKGRKPNKRPKKRPRVIQNILDDLFPGVWLSEINANMYKVD